MHPVQEHLSSSMAGLPLPSEGRRLVTWRFHSLSLAKRRSSFWIIPQLRERGSVIGLANAKCFIQWKFLGSWYKWPCHVAYTSVESAHFGQQRGLPHGMKMPHGQKLLFFLLKLQNIPYPMTNCECGNVSEPQGFPSIRVSKSASHNSSWLDVAQWWLWRIDAGYSALAVLFPCSHPLSD
jgi:hypothetical protein